MKNKEERPKLKIDKEPVDRFFEIIGLIGVVLLVALPFVHFGSLPDTVPVHYGINGQPDSYGSKNMVWLLMVVGIIIYISLAVLTRYPHIFNYPKKITAENAYTQYKMACRLIRVLNAVSAWFFAYIVYTTIAVASGRHSGPGSWLVVALIGVTALTMGVYIYKAMKK